MSSLKHRSDVLFKTYRLFICILSTPKNRTQFLIIFRSIAKRKLKTGLDTSFLLPKHAS